MSHSCPRRLTAWWRPQIALVSSCTSTHRFSVFPRVSPSAHRPTHKRLPNLPFAASEARQGVQLLLIMGFFNNRECNSAGQRTGVDPACPLFMDIAATQAVDSEMKQVYTEGLIQGASCCKP